MNSREYWGLSEAYAEVYAPQEESFDEGYKSPNKKRIQRQSDDAYKNERRALDRGDSDEAMRQNRRRNAMNTPSTRRNELESKNRKEEFDIFDNILEHLIDEGYADTEEAAIVIMANMSEEWRQEIVEAEVLAMKGGVPGSVKVRPALSIPGTNIGVGPNKPVPGTFTTTTPGQREKISQGSTTINRGTYQQSRVGAGPTSSERSRYNKELVRQGKTTAPRMSQ